jgi:DUF917 family protein
MGTLSVTEMQDILRGAGILGTGGGGDPVKAGILIERIARAGRKVRLVGMDELGDDEVICTIFMVGSSGSNEMFIDLKPVLKNLENYIGTKFSAIIPVEIGAGAVAETFYLSSSICLPVLDADIVGGRSSPEVYIETITMCGIQRTPLIAININGKCKFIRSAVSPKKIEKILRDFAKKSGGYVYVVGYPMKVSDIKYVVGTGTISKARQIGKNIRVSLKNGANPIDCLAKSIGAKELFRGDIKHVEINDRDGFLTGSLIISGKDRYTDSELKIWFKNENIVSWLDGNPLVTIPDLICVIDKNGYGVYNRDVRKGMAVSVIGMQSLPLWRTKKGLNLFSPESFGFNIEYKPI